MVRINYCTLFPQQIVNFSIITVPRKVLKDLYDVQPETDEPNQENSADLNELYDEDQFYKESEAIPPAPKLQGGISNGDETGSGSSSTDIDLTAISTLQPTSVSISSGKSYWFEGKYSGKKIIFPS